MREKVVTKIIKNGCSYIISLNLQCCESNTYSKTENVFAK